MTINWTPDLQWFFANPGIKYSFKHQFNHSASLLKGCNKHVIVLLALRLHPTEGNPAEHHFHGFVHLLLVMLGVYNSGI